jgi:hypothetical protein
MKKIINKKLLLLIVINIPLFIFFLYACLIFCMSGKFGIETNEQAFLASIAFFILLIGVDLFLLRILKIWSVRFIILSILEILIFYIIILYLMIHQIMI